MLGTWGNRWSAELSQGLGFVGRDVGWGLLAGVVSVHLVYHGFVVVTDARHGLTALLDFLIPCVYLLRSNLEVVLLWGLLPFHQALSDYALELLILWGRYRHVGCFVEVLEVALVGHVAGFVLLAHVDHAPKVAQFVAEDIDWLLVVELSGLRPLQALLPLVLLVNLQDLANGVFASRPHLLVHMGLGVRLQLHRCIYCSDR